MYVFLLEPVVRFAFIYSRIATKCDFVLNDQIQFSDFNSSLSLLGESKVGTIFIINRALLGYRAL